MDFNLKVSEPELRLIAQAMQDMPYRVVADLIKKIQGQVNEQVAAAETAPARKTPKPEKGS